MEERNRWACAFISLLLFGLGSFCRKRSSQSALLLPRRSNALFLGFAFLHKACSLSLNAQMWDKLQSTVSLNLLRTLESVIYVQNSTKRKVEFSLLGTCFNCG
jgi:hypothetical protein